MREKLEVIIYSGDEIQIQDISSLLTKLIRKHDLPLRIPSTKELYKITNAVINTVNQRLEE